MALRFHWMLPKSGEVVPGATQSPLEAMQYRVASVDPGSPAPRPEMDGWIFFSQHAEAAGIDSVLISFSRYEPDPFLVSCALGRATSRLRFMIAYRSGLMQPAAFVQQINTLSGLIDGRLSLNLVAGSSTSEQHGYGDFLSHDERYARAEEFLSVCHAFWRNGGSEVDFDGRYYRVERGHLFTPFLDHGRKAPEIYISGHSEAALRLVATQGSCWLRIADTPDKIASDVKRMRDAGIPVCLRMCILCRPTHEEALEAAQSLLSGGDFEGQGRTVRLKDDSQMHKHGAQNPWLSESLWTGLVPHYGPVWTTLLGTPRELADAFLAWRDAGVSEFILSGWPEVDTVSAFGREVLPLIRREESCP
ncbi:MAG TPA: LLM class flavin-dependent oxidoreductase [Thermoanaerobaculia bacterium]|nr:LLM class flavin-dependent oxidoreductase [Thermoanaerobaculia bacterium]